MKRKPILIAFVLLLLASNVVGAANSIPLDAGQAYTVRSGDTLQRLAIRFYGDVDAWAIILEATNAKAAQDSSFAAIADSDSIILGQKLWIPDAAEVAPLLGETLPTATAHIVERGLLDCFEAGLTTSEGKAVNCETSAVVYTGSDLIYGSDKPIPGETRSSVFSTQPSASQLVTGAPTYLTAPPIVNAIKYEDFTLTPDGQYVIATTGFDRVKSSSSGWDNYNTLLVWPTGNPAAASVAAASTADGVTSSVSLRARFSRALANSQFPGGRPYFKVEGLAAIPGNRLLFGIRELGASYKDFDYALKIVAASYQIVNGELLLADDFELIYDYYPQARPELGHSVALSSLEYDQHGDRLYMLTSFEDSESDVGVGGFLWILSLADLYAHAAPTLVFRDAQNPLLFAHKSEGVTVLDAQRVFVIHDDDRVLGRETVSNPETEFSRQANQAAYTVVVFGR